MKWLSLLLLVSCTTNPVTGETEPDWQAMDREFTAAIGDPESPELGSTLQRVTSLVEEGSPEAADELERAREALLHVRALVHEVAETGEPVDILDAVRRALALMDQLTAEIEDDGTRLAVKGSLLGLQETLGRIAMYTAH